MGGSIAGHYDGSARHRQPAAPQLSSSNSTHVPTEQTVLRYGTRGLCLPELTTLCNTPTSATRVSSASTTHHPASNLARTNVLLLAPLLLFLEVQAAPKSETLGVGRGTETHQKKKITCTFQPICEKFTSKRQQTYVQISKPHSLK